MTSGAPGGSALDDVSDADDTMAFLQPSAGSASPPAPASASASPMLRLPRELFEQISAHLSLSDALTLERQTCKALRAASLSGDADAGRVLGLGVGRLGDASTSVGLRLRPAHRLSLSSLMQTSAELESRSGRARRRNSKGKGRLRGSLSAGSGPCVEVQDQDQQQADTEKDTSGFHMKGVRQILTSASSSDRELIFLIDVLQQLLPQLQWRRTRRHGSGSGSGSGSGFEHPTLTPSDSTAFASASNAASLIRDEESMIRCLFVVGWHGVPGDRLAQMLLFEPALSNVRTIVKSDRLDRDAWTTSTLTTLSRAAALAGLAGQAVRLEYARELQADRAHHSGEWRRSASALSASSAFLCAHLIAQNLPLVHPLHDDGDADDASGALAAAAAEGGDGLGGGAGREASSTTTSPAGPAGSAFRRTARHYRVDSAGSLRAKRLSWEGKKLPRVPGEPPDSDSASASSSASASASASASTSGPEQRLEQGQGQGQSQGATSSAGASSMRTIAELRNATTTTRVATPTPTSPATPPMGRSAAVASPEPVLPPAEPARRRSAVPAPAPASASASVPLRPPRAEDAVEMRGGVYTQASVRIGSRKPPFAVKGMGLMAGYDCLCFLPPAATAATAAARGQGGQGGGRDRAEKAGQNEQEGDGRWHPLEHIIFQGRHTLEEASELERMFEWSDLLCIHCKREIVF